MPRGQPWESGRASLYSAAAHSWLLPLGRAVCSAIVFPECRAVRSWLLHLPLSSGATPECPLSNSVLKSQNQEFLPPLLHIPTCVQRADLFKCECPRQAQSWPRLLCPPIGAPELAGIPLQPPTVVGTCPAHAFHPDATLIWPGRIVVPLAPPTLDNIRSLGTLRSRYRRPTLRTVFRDPQSFRPLQDRVAAAGQSRTLPGWAFAPNTHPDKSCAFTRHPSLGPSNIALGSHAAWISHPL